MTRSCCVWMCERTLNTMGRLARTVSASCTMKACFFSGSDICRSVQQIFSQPRNKPSQKPSKMACQMARKNLVIGFPWDTTHQSPGSPPFRLPLGYARRLEDKNVLILGCSLRTSGQPDMEVTILTTVGSLAVNVNDYDRIQLEEAFQEISKIRLNNHREEDHAPNIRP